MERLHQWQCLYSLHLAILMQLNECSYVSYPKYHNIRRLKLLCSKAVKLASYMFNICIHP